jgi:hypothetical protein
LEQSVHDNQKFAAVQWAIQTLDVKWHELIQEAWTEREGVRFGSKVAREHRAKQ